MLLLRHLRLLALLFILHSSSSVDRSNFKTCDQSSFCRRCRKMEPGQSVYELDLDTLETSQTEAKVQLVNTDQNVRFNLRLSPLLDNTLRIQIVEAEPLRERFEPPYILVGDPSLSKLSLVSKSAEAAKLSYEGYKIHLNAVPFRIDVISGSNVIMSVNARGLFRFEHTIQKPEERDEKEDPGIWEENFKSHHDSKPHGPTAVAMDVSFFGARVAYGLPEHADSLPLRTTTDGDPYRFYNLDVFEYEVDSPMALYAAIPFLVAHSEERTGGVFWLNPSETWTDVVTSKDNVVSSLVNLVSGAPQPRVDTHWMSEAGNVDMFLHLGPHPQDVFRQYTRLTGTHPLPPEFTLGYHQSRWNYNDEEDVAAVHQSFDDHEIPVDVIWLDIEHTDGKKYFTWDPYKFSHPIEMQQNLTAKGRNLVVIVDPHIKRDPGYFLHNDATNNGYYVKNKDNNDYEGWCWPGASSYLDLVNPVVRDYHSSRFHLDTYTGSTEGLYIWNDMNEPSVFNGPEITMPKDNIHHGGVEHREIHNMYGFLHVMSTYKGLLERSGRTSVEETKRPFVLTRSAFAGSQRFAAIWTGDNDAEWSHLAASIPMCLSLAIGGMSFCGADVGGFFHNPDRELFTRWYQAGAFLPFFRAHSHIDTRRREPWLFDEEVTAAVRDAINLRYSFLPLWYTAFYQNNITGAPVIRPLWAEFPSEVETFAIDDEFLVGNALLVRPVTQPGLTEVPVHFPGVKTLWYDIKTYEVHRHGQSTVPAPFNEIPVYQKGGTIIPRKMRIRRASLLMQNDPYTLVIALDAHGTASGYLYMDDGITHRYRFRKDSSVLMHLKYADNTLTASHVGDHRYDTPCTLERVIILGLKPGSYKATASHDGGVKKSLETIYDTQKALIIRKPALAMNKTWHIKLH